MRTSPVLMCIRCLVLAICATVAAWAAEPMPPASYDPVLDEVIVKGGNTGTYAISVYNKDGTPSRLMPARIAAERALKGGGGTDAFASGRMQVLIIRVAYPDDQREFCSEQEAYQTAKQVTNYYVENSYNKVQVAFDVTPLLNMPHSFLRYKEQVVHVTADSESPTFGDGVSAAVRAGFTGNYDCYAVVHRPYGSPSTSLITLNGGMAALAHELGHQLGAGHDDRWRTDGLGSIGALDWRRSGDSTFGDTNRIDDIYEYNVEAYGDDWSIMGSGGGHWSPYFKISNGWLPQAYIQNVTASGRFRVTAFDYPELEQGRTYALLIRKNSQQYYLAGFRCRQVDGRPARLTLPQEQWFPTSLSLYGNAWDSSREKNTPPSASPYLIDTTPGTPSGLTGAPLMASGHVTLPVNGDCIDDSGLNVGRTFSDWPAGIHITVVDKAQTEPQSLDVVVNRGTFPNNRKPVLTIRPSTPALTGNSGQILVPLPVAPATSTAMVDFVAEATDADGDTLAYYWDFGDWSNASRNDAQCGHAWSAADVGAGRLFVVRCTVTDMKGGTASASLAINVGLPEYPGVDAADLTGRQKFYARGRIVDQAGVPVEGIRVAWVGTPYLGTYTDSDGSYILPQLPRGDHAIEAIAEGWRCIGVNDAAPLPNTITFPGRDLDKVDFIAVRRQTVGIVPQVASIAAGATAKYLITRTAPAFGTFDQPAPYVQPADFIGSSDIAVASKRQLFVRIYPGGQYASPLVDERCGTAPNPVGSSIGAWRWRAYNRATLTWGAWQALADFDHLRFQTPERMQQYRQESGPPRAGELNDANPTNDYFVRFDQNEDQIELERTTAATLPVHQGEVRALIAFGVDYEIANGQGEGVVAVVNPSPAATPTVSLTAYGAGTENGSDGWLIKVSTDVPAPERLVIPVAATLGAANLSGVPAEIVIEPGMRVASFLVASVDDRVMDGGRSASISISGGAGYNLGAPTTVNLSIADNDAPVVFITNPVGPAREGNDTGTAVVAGSFEVFRAGSLKHDLVVNLAVSGTAIPGGNYVALPATVTIPAGADSVSVPVTPKTDGVTTGDRTVIATVAAGADYRSGNPVAATCIIQDAQLPDVTIELVGSATISESAGTVTVRLKRLRASTSAYLDVLVNLSGTVEYGLHWKLQPDPLTITTTPMLAGIQRIAKLRIPAGQTQVDYQLQANSDLVRELTQESPQYCFLQLVPASQYNLPWNKDSVEVHITDTSSGGFSNVALEVPTYRIRAGDAFNIDAVVSDWISVAESLDGQVQSVDYTIEEQAPGTPGKAFAGTDFVADSGTLVYVNPRPLGLAYNVRRAAIAVQTLADPAATTERTFLVTLSNPVNCTLPEIKSGSSNLRQCLVTIIPTGMGTISVSAPIATAIPGGADGLIRVSRTVATAQPVSLKLVVQGNATPYVDYQQFGADAVFDDGIVHPTVTGGDSTMTRLVTIPAGADHLDIPIHALFHGTVEPNETLSVYPLPPDGYEADPTSATVIIPHSYVDTRSLVTVVATDPCAGETGPDVGVFTFTRTGGTLTVPLTVPIALSGLSTAAAGDYLAIPASITFAANQTTLTLSVTPVNDALVEDTETVIVGLVADNSSQYTVGEPSGATIRITDNDRPLPEVRVDADIPNVVEGGAATDLVARFRLTRAKETMAPLTVGFALTGTATAGADYTAIPAITFPAGATQVLVEVAPIQDALSEGVESVILTLTSGAGYQLVTGAAAATVDIIDDDAATVTIARKQDGGEAGSSDLVYTLTRVGADLSAPLTVDLTLSGTPTDGAVISTDTVQPASITATFAAGVATVDVPVTPVDDLTVEADEGVIATLAASGAGYVAGVPDAATAAILDDDQTRISIAIPGSADGYKNPVTPVTMTLTRTLTVGALSVNYTVSGTADSGADYVGLTGTVDFADGVATADVVITPVASYAIKAPATVIVTLSPSVAYNLDPVLNTATANIYSDDQVRMVIIGPPNHALGGFCGDLTFRIYRLGSTAGPVRVGFSVVPDADPTTLDVDIASFQAVSGQVDVTDGYADMSDGQASVDVIARFAGSYVPDLRRMVTVQVDNPVISGVYLPGGIPGVANGMAMATTQELKSTDVDLVKLVAADASASEGYADTAALAVVCNQSPVANRPCTIVRQDVISIAAGPGVVGAGNDFDLSANPVNVIAATVTASATLTAFADYNTAEGDEIAVLGITQPTAPVGVDPAFWVVNLPATITLHDGPSPAPRMVVLRDALRFNDGGQDYLPDALAPTVTVTESYVIRNEGSLDLIITGFSESGRTNLAALAPVFGSAFPVTLAAGATMTMDVPINPDATGLWIVDFTFTTNEVASPFNLRIRGYSTVPVPAGAAGANYSGTADSGGCGGGSAAGLLLGAAMALGLRRRRR